MPNVQAIAAKSAARTMQVQPRTDRTETAPADFQQVLSQTKSAPKPAENDPPQPKNAPKAKSAAANKQPVCKTSPSARDPQPEVKAPESQQETAPTPQATPDAPQPQMSTDAQPADPEPPHPRPPAPQPSATSSQPLLTSANQQLPPQINPEQQPRENNSADNAPPAKPLASTPHVDQLANRVQIEPDTTSPKNPAQLQPPLSEANPAQQPSLKIDHDAITETPTQDAPEPKPAPPPPGQVLNQAKPPQSPEPVPQKSADHPRAHPIQPQPVPDRTDFEPSAQTPPDSKSDSPPPTSQFRIEQHVPAELAAPTWPMPPRAAASAPALPTSDRPPADVPFADANHPSIVTAIRTELVPHGGSMRIRLDPPELGAMQVNVEIRDGVITASFQTSTDDATRLLSHSLHQLKQSLETQGVSVDRLHVEQTRREKFAGGSRDDGQQQQPQDHAAQQEQQRREMLQRMWRRLRGDRDPLDVLG